MEIKPARNRKSDLSNIRYLNLFRLLLGLFFFSVIFEKFGQIVGLSYNNNFILAKYSVAFYLAFAILVWILSSILPNKSILIGLIALVIDLPVIIFLAILFDGIDDGWAILPVITIGSYSILSRRPYTILAMPVSATLFLWIFTRFLSPQLGSAETSSILLYSLTYFAIALVGIRQSQNYHKTLLLTQTQKKTIVDLSDLNQNIINQMHSGVIAFDRSYRVLSINKKARDLTKIAAREILPPHIIKKIIATKESETGHMVIMGEDLVFHTVKGKKLTDSGLLFLEPQRQINERSQQSNLATMGQLSATVAHELRNPMASMYSASQLLQESETLSEEDKVLTDIIAKHIERSNKIIEDILMMSKPHIAEKSEIDIAQFIQNFISAFISDRGDINKENFNTHVPDNNLKIQFDSSHLQQVFWNLADNAFKHNKNICLNISVSNQADYVLVDFKNEGEPFASIVEESLFSPFFTTHTQGTGLGLYICREICKSNDAKLEYLRQEFQHVFRIHIKK